MGKSRKKKKKKKIGPYTVTVCYMPLSRRLGHCDRVIQNESGYSNGGNV